VINDESDQFNPRDPRAADAGKPSKSEKRRAARQMAMQALYQRHMAGQSLNEIEAQFRVDNDFTSVDASYFHDILHGVPANQDKIDAALAPCLDLTIEELDPVELAVLRLSTWELLERIDVPYRVSSTKASSWRKSTVRPMATSSSTACSTSWLRVCAKSK
jgi:N utilization substance protein B